MTAQEFFDKWDGKLLDYDKAYGGQCVDVYDQYCVEVVNAPVVLVNGAKDIWNNYPTNFFDKIDNIPDNFPLLGDVVIWGTKIGKFGHVAICHKATIDNFISFDQNYPEGSLCHFQWHDYTGVLGWLRPKSLPQDQQVVIDELRIARDKNWDLYQEEMAKNNELIKQLQEEQRKSQDLREINDRLTKTDADLGIQLLDAQHERDELRSIVDSVCDALGSSTTLVSILKAIDDLKQPQDVILKDREKLLNLIFNDLVYQRVPKYLKSIRERFWRWIK